LAISFLNDSGGVRYDPNYDFNVDLHIPLSNTISARQNNAFTSNLPHNYNNQGGNDLIIYWKHIVYILSVTIRVLDPPLASWGARIV